MFYHIKRKLRLAAERSRAKLRGLRSRAGVKFREAGGKITASCKNSRDTRLTALAGAAAAVLTAVLLLTAAAVPKRVVTGAFILLPLTPFIGLYAAVAFILADFAVTGALIAVLMSRRGQRASENIAVRAAVTMTVALAATFAGFFVVFKNASAVVTILLFVFSAVLAITAAALSHGVFKWAARLFSLRGICFSALAAYIIFIILN